MDFHERHPLLAVIGVVILAFMVVEVGGWLIMAAAIIFGLLD